METAGDRLHNEGAGDLTWLEHGLRDASNQACCGVVAGLLAMAGLRVPGDHLRMGERRLKGVPRTIHTLFGEVPVRRTWYKSPDAPDGRFPLDEALGLIDGHTPALVSLISRDAGQEPFEAASKGFRPHTGVCVDGRQFQRLVARVGLEVEAYLQRQTDTQAESVPRVYIEMDATGAPLRHTELAGRKGKGADGQAQTHEVKVAALFTEHPRPGQPPWRDCGSTSYVATTLRCHDFGYLVRAEFDRRFYEPRELVALGDGAVWIWEQFDLHFPQAVQIVDFHHAAEHVAALAELAAPRGSKEWKRLRRKWTSRLWQGRLDAMMAAARQSIPARHTIACEKALDYFEHNRARMRYAYFRKQGYFIGSGVVESACKTIVGTRFKGAGMHWSLRGLNNLLPIRTALCSNRYDAFWTWRANKLHGAA